MASSGAGLAVPPDDPRAPWPEAFAALAADRTRIDLMGRRARVLAEARFARTTMIDRWGSMLCNLG